MSEVENENGNLCKKIMQVNVPLGSERKIPSLHNIDTGCVRSGCVRSRFFLLRDLKDFSRLSRRKKIVFGLLSTALTLFTDINLQYFQ